MDARVGAWSCAFVGAMVIALPGCTAAASALQCRRADQMVNRASELAVTPARTYHLTLARAYLDKAREEAGEAQYGESHKLAKASQRASRYAESGMMPADRGRN